MLECRMSFNDACPLVSVGSHDPLSPSAHRICDLSLTTGHGYGVRCHEMIMLCYYKPQYGGTGYNQDSWMVEDLKLKVMFRFTFEGSLGYI